MFGEFCSNLAKHPENQWRAVIEESTIVLDNYFAAKDALIEALDKELSEIMALADEQLAGIVKEAKESKSPKPKKAIAIMR